MRKPFIAGNWKMHGSQSMVSTLLTSLSSGLNKADADIVVFPSFVYLSQSLNHLKESDIGVGAQNLNEHEKGAFTGEVSGDMLKDIECQYVLVGHSERRHLFGETNELVALKFEAALKAGLVPVLCIGETESQRQEGSTEEVISAQITAVIEKMGVGMFEQAIIAYEPVWAIGTGLTATPDQAQSIHQYIRSLIASHSVSISESVRIVYGGSVKPANAAELFQMADIDGGLVGGASLKADEFIAICQSYPK